MIWIIWFSHSRKLVCVCFPVKITTVYNCSAYCHSMTIHIFCSWMCNNVNSIFKRSAINRCWESIVNNKWHSMSVGCLAEFFKIKYNKRRIWNWFSKNTFCIWSELFFQIFRWNIRINKCYIYSHLLHCYSKKIKGSSVNIWRADKMISRFTNIKYSVKISCLTWRCKHCCSSTFKFTNLWCHRIVSWVL